MLEVLLSMGILVLLTSMTYWFYSSALGTREADLKSAQDLQLIRVVLDRMADEIRQSSLITAGQRVGIRGEGERIWISTLRTPAKGVAEMETSLDAPTAGEYDLVKIEYKIARHPELLHEEDGYPRSLGLARVEHRIPRPAGLETQDFLAGALDGLGPEVEIPGEVSAEDELLFEDEEDGAGVGIEDEIPWNELYSKDILFLRFCYFDGYRWWDDWDIFGENPLPQLVQVTVGFEEHPPLDAEFGVRDEEAEEFCTCMNREPMDCLTLPADQFTYTIRIPQADPFFRSRVGREMKSLLEQAGEGEAETGEDGEASGQPPVSSGKSPKNSQGGK